MVHTANRLANETNKTKQFIVSASLSMESGNNHQVAAYIAKNDVIVTDSKTVTTTSGTGKADNVSCQTMVQLAPGEYVEVWVENATAATNITVTELSLICREI